MKIKRSIPDTILQLAWILVPAILLSSYFTNLESIALEVFFLAIPLQNFRMADRGPFYLKTTEPMRINVPKFYSYEQKNNHY